jgi:chemotaxis methyl-accepting protein methylase
MIYYGNARSLTIKVLTNIKLILNKIMETNYTSKILTFIKEIKNQDFSEYHQSTLASQIGERIKVCKKDNISDYFSLLRESAEEQNNLIESLTIGVSYFFRDSLSFELLNKVILPELISNKKDTLRIWSAGCFTGEEPYSIAILIKELIEKLNLEVKTIIFATDIDEKALNNAKSGSYLPEKMKNVKYSNLEKYFTLTDGYYKIKDEIKEMVNFSYHNLLNKSFSVPKESIFGQFDIILCRNVIIYFTAKTQRKIFKSLTKSLKLGGYLFLGEAEFISNDLMRSLKQASKFCNLYEKME